MSVKPNHKLNGIRNAVEISAKDRHTINTNVCIYVSIIIISMLNIVIFLNIFICFLSLIQFHILNIY